VPLIISAPERFKGGRMVDEMVQLFDLGPSILEWAGAELDETHEAESLNCALKGDRFEGRDHVFCEQSGDVNFTGAKYMTMVRSKTHKLVHFMDHEFGQLFDLTSQKGETENLWDDPDSAATKQELLDVLREWHISSAYNTRVARRAMIN